VVECKRGFKHRLSTVDTRALVYSQGVILQLTAVHIIEDRKEATMTINNLRTKAIHETQYTY
jgi:hypothetical protein